MRRIFFLWIAFPALLFAQDTLILQYPKYSGERFNKILPWSTDSAVAIMTENRIGTTTDGGYHWYTASIDSFELSGLAHDRSAGGIYAYGCLNDRIRIRRSTDAGRIWPLVKEFFTRRDPSGVAAFGFDSPDRGYFKNNGGMGFCNGSAAAWNTMNVQNDQLQAAGGKYYIQLGSTVFRSDDFGGSWQVHCKTPGDAGITMIDMLTYYSGRSSTYRTADGGVSWIPINQPQAVVQYFTRNTGVAMSGPDLKVYLTTDGGASWRVIDKGDNRHLAFLDDRFGYIWSNRGLLARTVDGSVSWDTIFTPVPLYLPCRQVHMSSSGAGFSTVGRADDYLPQFLATTDYGEHWNPVSSATSEVPYLAHFWGDDTGYGVGIDSTRNAFTLLETTDGGLQWRRRSDIFPFDQRFKNDRPRIMQSPDRDVIAVGTDSLQLYLSTDGGSSWSATDFKPGKMDWSQFISIWFADQSFGYIFHNRQPGGVTYKTTDGGVTWETREQSIPAGSRDIRFINPTTGWMRSLSNGLNTVYKTTDGGNSWNSIVNLPGTGNSFLHFRTPALGMLLTDDPGPGIYRAAITSDSGKSWQPYVFFGKGNISDCCILKDTTFWVAGSSENYFVKRGILRRKTTGIRSLHRPVTATVLSPYPNPALGSESVTIPLRLENLPPPERSDILLYDALGRRMGVEPSILSGGEDALIRIPAANLPGGMYLFSLGIGKGSERKMFFGRFLIAR